jgi:hypothetical protein
MQLPAMARLALQEDTSSRRIIPSVAAHVLNCPRQLVSLDLLPQAG